MKPLTVAYVAKHDQPNADDEGAITYALEQLGHRVERLREHRGRIARRLQGDFLLFHHWQDLDSIQSCSLPKVWWYFDLVDFPSDHSLIYRCRARSQYARAMTQVIDLGFMTDGDWVDGDASGKLHWMPQGFDERLKPAKRRPQGDLFAPDILFTGTAKGGEVRQRFVEEMHVTYGAQFNHVERGAYRTELAELIAQHKIVVAPDGPVTGKYWSNRVYNVLGLGGFLIHPWCQRLSLQYMDGEDLIFYHGRTDLHEKIRRYLDLPEERARIAQMGSETTRAEHTYRHRVSKIIDMVRERLL